MMRVDHRDHPETERRRPTAVLPFHLAWITALALVSACYLWFSYTRPIEPGSSKLIAAAGIADPVETRETVRASQQKMAAELEAMTQDVLANKADLQKLSDQVSALAAKIDGLRDAAAAWPASGIARQPNPHAQASAK